MIFQGGIYLFKIFDFYSCSGMSLLWVVFFQTIAIGWFFGAQRFCDCVEQMTGSKPNKFFYLCWKFFAPAVMIVSSERYKYSTKSRVFNIVIFITFYNN